eukprot:4715555-Pyramimonas_sp.AAC.1
MAYMHSLVSSPVIGCFWGVHGDGHSSYMRGRCGVSGTFPKMSSSGRTVVCPSAMAISTARSMSRSDMALAPPRALAGLSVLRAPGGLPRALPCGVRSQCVLAS